MVSEDSGVGRIVSKVLVAKYHEGRSQHLAEALALIQAFSLDHAKCLSVLQRSHTEKIRKEVQ